VAEPPTNIRLLVLDVDGVMTDGSICIDDRGVETKRFHVRDGTAIRMWTKLGGHVAIITGRKGMAVQHRANELGIAHVLQGVADKAAAFRDVLKSVQVDASQAAVLADDVPDLPMLRLAGYPMAVSDAVEEVKAAARFISSARGGHAAVREAVEHLLKASGRWPDAVAIYDRPHDSHDV
jgi:3-deoxy-D-manno-octulosonate 8-phosphate phosphatase (KDO 8-P phosphatase)